jgi:hypothetical protein
MAKQSKHSWLPRTCIPCRMEVALASPVAAKPQHTTVSILRGDADVFTAGDMDLMVSPHRAIAR